MKKILWNINEVGEALNKIVKGEFLAPITGVSTDSRTIEKGDMFFALSGENFNGNDFIDDAIRKGASVCISGDIQKVNSVNIEKVIQVDNVLEALNSLAIYRRKSLKGVVIGITGSLGKTSTKEMFRLALSSCGKTFATKKNLNNHYGLPLSLISCPKDVDFCILELGMSAKGEIANLTKIANPDVAVITNIHPVHLEFFNSIEEIAYAKSEIFENIAPSGFGILNTNSNHFEIQNNQAKEYGVKICTFGKNSKADCYIKNIDNNSKMYKIAHINCYNKGYTQKFDIDVGEHLIFNSLAIFICAVTLNLDLNSIQKSLENFKPQSGRGEVIELKSNMKLVDESYNSSPEALASAIQNLKSLKADTSRVIAILGDMKELGDKEMDFHKNIKLNGVDKIFCVGKLMENLYNHSNQDIRGVCTENSAKMAEIITDYLKEDDIMLVKGSLSMNMKLIVDKIKTEFRK
ncbi:UDP-N-acetylmuramoyl-tripeptide--D-alanyl-D-alanine ligase [Candidatus Bandiella numerosa]|uniref:UDP-N-acetylmuramoyl-tripeptide--D-alanyl-D- alanine ligase n=1 Tax=Candidatus Bandiella numerosa TaxID=2570586 RepID=UPI001F315CE5|nr:UDP-N-acetylmuramoyl-tripeptide--D-alanyl-D-alanine ligase [Candidatus Bandiella numerosa]